MAHNHILENDVFEDEVDLEAEEETMLFFNGLLRWDEGERAQFMETFGRSIKSWMSKTDDIAAQRLLEVHLPSALMMSVNAPFSDIRTKMKKLLEEVQLSGYDIPKPLFEGPSSFVPRLETVAYSSSPDAALSEVQSLYEESFMHEGHLSNIIVLLGYHPSYLSRFIKTHDFLMHGNGPLPLHIRNYIAILAASRHKCSYLVACQEAEFLRNRGDQRWLQGLQHLPNRMVNLLNLNKTLAHQPWFVNPEQMKDLLRGADSWSIAELVHAIVIMAHFHALAGFALGCGINPEINFPFGHTFSDSTDNSLPKQPYYSNPALGILGTPTPSDSDLTDFTDSAPISPTDRQMSETRVQHYIENHTYFEASSDGVNEPVIQPRKLTDCLTETLKTMENEGSSDEENAELNNKMFVKAASSAGMETKVQVPTPSCVAKYLDDASYEHEDFTNTSAVTLRARDYSWEDHGFPFVNGLYPDIAPLLDDKFTLAFQLTYRTCGEQKNIDTHPFREAIWYYIHSIKGIRHDDYHYRKVNQVLEIPFKSYIRMLSCFPEKITFFDFNNSMSGLQHSEKVHVNVLVLEARLQAELIYALRAIMTYMKAT